MESEPFCDFGQMPKAYCAHCRTYGQVIGPRPPMYQDTLRPLSAAEVQRWLAARYGGRPDHVIRWRWLNDPEYHARVTLWEQMMRSAFGPDEDWPALMEAAQTGELGPWITSAYRSVCRGCGERWEEGEQIRFSEDEGGWICFSCGSADP